MSNFEEWFEDYEDKFEINAEILCKDAFQAGAKSQQAKIDDLTELNRLRTIALEQSVNRTSIHVHEKIIALENKLKGNKDEN